MLAKIMARTAVWSMGEAQDKHEAALTITSKKDAVVE
jgi:hypothetical protein